MIAALTLQPGPALAAKNKDAVAIIIGNKDYTSRIPAVEFAHRDADAFKVFVTDVLGYPSENIIDLRDSTKAQSETAFGNRVTHEGKLWRYHNSRGKSDVMVFYSGHGVPGLRDRMGDLRGGGNPEEKPVHEVGIDYSFAVGKYEVTQAQWRAIMGNKRALAIREKVLGPEHVNVAQSFNNL